MASKYLTPTLSELAYEQIIAWYEHQSGQLYNGQSSIDTKGMNLLLLNNSLEAVGASLELLQDNYIVQNINSSGQNTKLTHFFRGPMHIIINMGKLEARIAGNYFAKNNKSVTPRP